MSLARLEHTKKSLKPTRCEKCRDELPKGSEFYYFYVGFRSQYKHVRCTKAACYPRNSERESSLLSSAYAAMEDAEDNLSNLSNDSDTSEIESAVRDVADTLRETADAYRAADENFGGGGMTDSSERADTLETAADELEGFSLTGDDEPGYCDDHSDEDSWRTVQDGQFDDNFTPEADRVYRELDEARGECEDCRNLRDSWWDELLTEARDALSEVTLP